MSPRLVQILQVYDRLHTKTGTKQPLLKPARYVRTSIVWSTLSILWQSRLIDVNRVQLHISKGSDGDG